MKANEVVKKGEVVGMEEASSLQLHHVTQGRRCISSVAYRPRFGGDSQARTSQLVWTSWRETQLGRNQLDRYSWTGIGTGSAGQGSAIIGRDRYSAERDFLCVMYLLVPR